MKKGLNRDDYRKSRLLRTEAILKKAEEQQQKNRVKPQLKSAAAGLFHSEVSAPIRVWPVFEDRPQGQHKEGPNPVI
jgi:hypothetical protein